jgi:hypothetical protein
MTEFIAALIVFSLAIAGMATGVMFRGVRLKRSCGGLNNLKKLMGFNPCDACTQHSNVCPLRRSQTGPS